MRGHVSYDVVNRLSMGNLYSAVFNSVKKGNSSSIQQYLVGEGIMGKGKNILFFNYGRNALYALFKERFTGGEIIFPGFICPSTAWAAVKAGIRPRFVDVSLPDFNLDISLLSEEEIETADAIYIIEDTAQALFARYKGEYVGTLGDAVLLSMYKQTPNLHGAILLSDLKISETRKGNQSLDDLARLLWLTTGPHDSLLKIIRKRKGLPGESDELHREKALCQPSPLSLSLFDVLLPSLKDLVGQNQTIARHYQRRSKESKYLIPQYFSQDKEPSWFNFSVRLLPEIAQVRDALLVSLRRKGIFCDRLWHDSPVAINIFKEYLKGDCPNAKYLARSVINMPIKANYQEGDVDYLFDIIEETIRGLI